jgi:hypothetical protein
MSTVKYGRIKETLAQRDVLGGASVPLHQALYLLRGYKFILAILRFSGC